MRRHPNIDAPDLAIASGGNAVGLNGMGDDHPRHTNRVEYLLKIEAVGATGISGELTAPDRTLVTAEHTRFGSITFHPLLDSSVDILEASVDVAEMHAAVHEERVVDDDDRIVLTED